MFQTARELAHVSFGVQWLTETPPRYVARASLTSELDLTRTSEQKRMLVIEPTQWRSIVVARKGIVTVLIALPASVRVVNRKVRLKSTTSQTPYPHHLTTYFSTPHVFSCSLL